MLDVGQAPGHAESVLPASKTAIHSDAPPPDQAHLGEAAVDSVFESTGLTVENSATEQTHNSAESESDRRGNCKTPHKHANERAQDCSDDHPPDERITPLLCIPEEGRWLVAGSNGGDDRPPAWLLNLRACAAARVRFETEEHGVTVREASDEEAVELWPKLEASYSYYASYRKRTTRRIPVVILEAAR